MFPVTNSFFPLTRFGCETKVLSLLFPFANRFGCEPFCFGEEVVTRPLLASEETRIHVLVDSWLNGYTTLEAGLLVLGGEMLMLFSCFLTNR